jgi:hypothetical protein
MAMLALASCAGDRLTNAERHDLFAARRRWVEFGAASYQITVGRSCFCTVETTRPVIITVRNGQVESRRYEDTGLDVPAQIASAYPTVDGLFDIIDAAIAAHDERVDVLYDAGRGFPVSVEIDGAAMIADDEVFFGTRDFIVR